MPNEVVDVIHKLAAALKYAGGIAFTDKDRDIITGDGEKEDDQAIEHVAIPVSRPPDKE